MVDDTRERLGDDAAASFAKLWGAPDDAVTDGARVAGLLAKKEWEFGENGMKNLS